MAQAIDPWAIVGPVQPQDDSTGLWRSSERWVYRIRTADGALCAPSTPTMQRAGILLVRPALPLPRCVPGAVRCQSLSTGPLR